MADFKTYSKDYWRSLRAGGFNSNYLEANTLLSKTWVGILACRYALGPKGQPRVLIPLQKGEDSRILPKTDGLEIREILYTQDGLGHRYLDITCRGEWLEGVFGDFTDQLLTRIEGGEPPVEACLHTIEELRELVALARDGVTEDVLTGLIGELLVLEKLLKLSSDAWQTWVGPTGNRHDFRLGSTSMEVKTTKRPGNQKIQISASDQLSPPIGGNLYLTHVTLEPVPQGQLTLETVVSRILALSSIPAKISELLTMIGCPDASCPAWNRISYIHHSSQTYHVNENFPRITADLFLNKKIPPGISSLQYEVDLGFAGPCLVPKEYELGVFSELLIKK